MRISSRVRRVLTLGVAALLCLPHTALAQLRATVYVTGLSLPLEFVQNPADPAMQYVVEQGRPYQGHLERSASGGKLSGFVDPDQQRR